jgi:poly-gamma-glutamate synthesis protein (capsule biosynthesis protein)
MADGIWVAAVGDIALGPSARQALPLRWWERPSLRGALDRADIVFGNLEAPICNGAGPVLPKIGPTLESIPETAEILASLGFNVLSLANNHILDHGDDGLQSTATLLSKHGIGTVGAGMDRAQANHPLIMSCNGMKAGVLGYTYREEWGAGTIRSGPATINRRHMLRAVADLRSQVDLVIISLHTGLEGFPVPSPRDRRLAHDLINAGATLVLGHHPHVPQGIERFREGLIAYSLGNFIFHKPDAFLPFGRRVTLVLRAQCGRHRVEAWEIIPLSLSSLRPSLLNGRKRTVFFRVMDQRSNILKDPVIHRRIWDEKCRQQLINKGLFLMSRALKPIGIKGARLPMARGRRVSLWTRILAEFRSAHFYQNVCGVRGLITRVITSAKPTMSWH